VLIKRFVALRSVDLGVRDANVLVAQVSLPRSRYGEPAQQASFIDGVVQRASGLPGVRNVAAATTMPGSGAGTPIYLFEIRGRPEPDPSALPAAYYVAITPNYFSSLSVPILRGRDFTAADRANTNPVLIVDQALAHRYFADANPIGQRLMIAGDSTPREVIGLVGNVKQGGVGSEDHPITYAPLSQMPTTEFTFAVRMNGDVSSAARGIRSAIREVDPVAPVLDVGPYSDRIASVIAPDSFYAGTALVFSAIALLLCGIGLYGVVAFDVARQRREIGIRIALGASIATVRRQVVAAAMRLVLTGVVVGALAAFATQNVIRKLFVDVSADLAGLGVACAALLAAGLCAALVPALRASRVDPLVAMRAD